MRKILMPAVVLAILSCLFWAVGMDSPKAVGQSEYRLVDGQVVLWQNDTNGLPDGASIEYRVANGSLTVSDSGGYLASPSIDFFTVGVIEIHPYPLNPSWRSEIPWSSVSYISSTVDLAVAGYPTDKEWGLKLGHGSFNMEMVHHPSCGDSEPWNDRAQYLIWPTSSDGQLTPGTVDVYQDDINNMPAGGHIRYELADWGKNFTVTDIMDSSEVNLQVPTIHLFTVGKFLVHRDSLSSWGGNSPAGSVSYISSTVDLAVAGYPTDKEWGLKLGSGQTNMESILHPNCGTSEPWNDRAQYIIWPVEKVEPTPTPMPTPILTTITLTKSVINAPLSVRFPITVGLIPTSIGAGEIQHYDVYDPLIVEQPGPYNSSLICNGRTVPPVSPWQWQLAPHAAYDCQLINDYRALITMTLDVTGTAPLSAVYTGTIWGNAFALEAGQLVTVSVPLSGDPMGDWTLVSLTPNDLIRTELTCEETSTRLVEMWMWQAHINQGGRYNCTLLVKWIPPPTLLTLSLSVSGTAPAGAHYQGTIGVGAIENQLAWHLEPSQTVTHTFRITDRTPISISMMSANYTATIDCEGTPWVEKIDTWMWEIDLHPGKAIECKLHIAWLTPTGKNEEEEPLLQPRLFLPLVSR